MYEREGSHLKTSMLIIRYEHYVDEKRAKTIQLDISNRKLKGGLKLKGFINLEKLVCSNNRLIDLDLSDCLNLVELECDNNELENLDFLKPINQLERL